MEENESLFQSYVSGWKENNIFKILSVLSDECIIIESHGPTYNGLPIIEQWVQEWIKDGGRVLQWNITSKTHTQRVSFFEWEFKCDVHGTEHFLPGISVVKYTKDKISFIHEYRMTKKAFAWDATMRVSE